MSSSFSHDLALCPYCNRPGLDIVGDGLMNTTCQQCGAEIGQTEQWQESAGPGTICPECRNTILVADFDENRVPLAVCSDKECGYADYCIRDFYVLIDGTLPEGVTREDPDTWEVLEDSTNPDWMLDTEYDTDLEEGDDDIRDHRKPVQDIADNSMYKDIVFDLSENLSNYDDD
jgi:DNA-directed RNA polymerase subunit RPC12/RpoP